MGNGALAGKPTAAEVDRTPALTAELAAARRQIEATATHYQERLDALQAKLKSQSYDVDRLEMLNAELQTRINLLQAEVARLKRAQRVNVQDLAHIAGWLVSLAQAKGVALDRVTLDILRRRGWAPTRRPAGAPRL